MLFSMIPLEFKENTKIPLEKNINTVEHIISYIFYPVISPYPTVAIVAAAQ